MNKENIEKLKLCKFWAFSNNCDFSKTELYNDNTEAYMFIDLKKFSRELKDVIFDRNTLYYPCIYISINNDEFTLTPTVESDIHQGETYDYCFSFKQELIDGITELLDEAKDAIKNLEYFLENFTSLDETLDRLDNNEK